jgi:sterol desaturase/sphingolipid hydroxylase (fatty acid hydroxylase superfamily)
MSPGLSLLVVAGLFLTVAALERLPALQFAPTRFLRGYLVFVTPRLHRLHHVPATSRRNYDTILTVWDRVFGKLVSRDATPAERVGVPGQIDTYPQTFVAAFRQPLKEIRDRRNAPPALEPAPA